MSEPTEHHMTASQFITTNDSRRGAVPTPSGALPAPRRRRRGMLNLKAWDENVAKMNEANGTTSTSAKTGLLQTISANATGEAEKFLIEAGKRLPDGPPVTPPQPAGDKPAGPDDDTDIPMGHRPAARMSNGAILEDSQIKPARPPISLPTPSAAAIAAAKATLEAEKAAAENSTPADKIPSPPAAKKAATKTAKPATNK